MNNNPTRFELEFELYGQTVSALHFTHGPINTAIPRHSHGEGSYELHYISAGCGELLIEDTAYALSPGTFYMTGPHILHEQPASPDLAEYSLYFKIPKNPLAETKDPDPLLQQFLAVYFWLGPDTQNMPLILTQIQDEYKNPQSASPEYLKTLMQQCLIKIIRNYTAEAPKFPLIRPVLSTGSKSLITEESFIYDYNSITLDLLANRLGLSTRQTCRYLKETYNKTFSEKKLEAKMSAAKLLLQNSRLSLETLAETLNYSSLSHFSHAFHQYYQMSPGRYRDLLQQADRKGKM